MTHMNKLEIYVFTEVLSDYTDGMITIVAESYEEAIDAVKKNMNWSDDDELDHDNIAELNDSDWFTLPLQKGSMAYCLGGG